MTDIYKANGEVIPISEPFKIAYSTCPNNENVDENNKKSSALVAVRFHKESNKLPYAQGLIYLNVYDEKFYYSEDGINMKYLFTWDSSLAYNSSFEPYDYACYLLDNGDVVFVYRQDTFRHTSVKRCPPIIYKKSENYVGQVITFSEKMYPVGGVQNCAFEYDYTDNSFYIAEYVRASMSDVMNIWKVTAPYDTDASWNIVLTVNRSNPGSEINLKHFHAVEIDTYSGYVYAWTGDDDNYCYLYQSTDHGANWTLIKQGPEKHLRVLNMLFLEDAIYWGTDGGKEDRHYFMKALRNVDGTIDVNSFEEIYKFDNHYYNNSIVRYSTYSTCLIVNPYGVLFLNKFDIATTEDMPMYFYSFEEEKMHQLDTIKKLGDSANIYGFRNDAVTFYPMQTNDNKVLCGFTAYPNNLGVLHNEFSAVDNIGGVGAATGTTVTSNKNKVNNLAIEVYR